MTIRTSDAQSGCGIVSRQKSLATQGMYGQGHIISLALALAVLLAGCAAGQTRPESAEKVPAPEVMTESGASDPVTDAAPGSARNIDPDVLYKVLAGEISGQRNDYASATRLYLEAALASDDPEIAERATRVALFSRDAEAAQAAAARWLELEPDSPVAHRNLAALALRGGFTDQAVEHLTRVLENTPEEGQAWALIAELLRYAQDIDGAVSVMEQLVTRHPDDAEAHLAFSALLHQKGVEDKALEQVEIAMELRDHWPEALSVRAAILQDMGDLDGATRDLARAVKIDPEDESLRIRYAESLRQQGLYDAAQDQLAKLVQDAPVLVQRGFLALAAENYEQAETFAEQILRDGEDPDAGYFIRARAAEELGDIPRSLDDYEQIGAGRFYAQAQTRSAYLLAGDGRLDDARELLRRLRNDNLDLAEDLYLAEGDLLVQSGFRESAFDLYTHALENTPDSVNLRYARALLAENMGRLDITESDLRHIIIREPENAMALNALGYTLADRTDRYQEALQLIDEAYRLDPNEAAIVDSMGWVHYRLGNLDEAEMYLRRALELAYDPEIAAHLGEVLWVLGEREHALAVWKDALGKSPDSKIVLDTMQRFGQ